MADEKDEFRVIDRRASSGEGSDRKAQERADVRAGAGFTMKESPASGPSSPTQIDFSTLLLSLATGALIHMGLTPDPATRKISKNLEMARQNIELLELLEMKTKGNLTADEAQLLTGLLSEVRLRYVEASK